MKVFQWLRYILVLALVLMVIPSYVYAAPSEQEGVCKPNISGGYLIGHKECRTYVDGRQDCGILYYPAAPGECGVSGTSDAIAKPVATVAVPAVTSPVTVSAGRPRTVQQIDPNAYYEGGVGPAGAPPLGTIPYFSTRQAALDYFGADLRRTANGLFNGFQAAWFTLPALGAAKLSLSVLVPAASGWGVVVAVGAVAIAVGIALIGISRFAAAALDPYSTSYMCEHRLMFPSVWDTCRHFPNEYANCVRVMCDGYEQGWMYVYRLSPFCAR